MVAKKNWRRVRVVVELPVSGVLTEKDLRWAVERSLDTVSFNRAVQDKNRGGYQTGRMEIKEYTRVRGAEERLGTGPTPVRGRAEIYLQEQLSDLFAQVEGLRSRVEELEKHPAGRRSGEL